MSFPPLKDPDSGAADGPADRKDGRTDSPAPPAAEAWDESIARFLDDLDEPGEHREAGEAGDAPRHEAVVPASIKTEEARAAGDIPMLTEVVQVPRYDSEDLPQSFAEVDWGDLAQRVRENVLERLLRRSDSRRATCRSPHRS